MVFNLFWKNDPNKPKSGDEIMNILANKEKFIQLEKAQKLKEGIREENHIEARELSIQKVTTFLKRLEKLEKKLENLPKISEEERKDPNKLPDFFIRSELEHQYNHIKDELISLTSRFHIKREEIPERFQQLFHELVF